MKIWEVYKEKVCIYDKYNVSIYLGSAALSVAPKYRGLNLGRKIIEARSVVCAIFEASR